MKGPVAPHSHSNWVLLTLLNFSQSGECEVGRYCGFNLLLWISNNVEYLLMLNSHLDIVF